MKKTSAKILAVLLALIMSLSVFALTASAAGPAITLSIPSAKVGTDVTVTAKLSANSGAASGNFVLQYDTSKLTVKSMAASSAMSAYYPTCNTAFAEDCVRFGFAGINAITAAVDLATIVFTPKAEGSVELKIKSFKLSDINGTKITTATATGGTMTISAGSTVKYKLTYDANGGINPPSSQTYTSAGNRTISTTKPTWTGHVFDSWNTKANGSGDSYQPGDPIMVDKEITLYAQWTTATTNYTVTFNPNGGSVTPTSASCTAGSTVPLPTPARSLTVTYNANGGSGAPAAQTAALTCKGWGESAGATTVVGTCGGTYKPTTASKTLYAIWNSATVTLSSTKPTKAGNTFNGWNTKADGSGTSYSTSYTGKANVTLYAQWTPNATEQCTLTFNANGGSGAPAAITVNKGASATIPSQTPTKSGYTFVSWNTKADGTGTPYGVGSPVPMNSNLTVYAIWRANGDNPTAGAVLNVKASASVDYRADVTITATATGVPAGYVLAIYDGNTQVAKGDNASVSFHVGNMKAGKTYDIKVVDANGNVQQDGSGNNLSKSCAISVNDGFFAKIIAFFKGLFGLLPKVEIKP